MNSDRGGGSEFTANPLSSRRNPGLQNIETAILNLVQSKRTYPAFARTMMFKNYALESKFKTAIYHYALLMEVHLYWTYPIGMKLLLIFLEFQSISLLMQVHETSRGESKLVPELLQPVISALNNFVHFEFVFDLSDSQNLILYSTSLVVISIKVLAFLKLELDDLVKTRKSKARLLLLQLGRWTYIIFFTILFSCSANLLSKPLSCVLNTAPVTLYSNCLTYVGLNIAALVAFVFMTIFSCFIEVLTYDRGVHSERLWVRKNSNWMVYWKARISVLVLLANSRVLNETLIFFIGFLFSLASLMSVERNPPFYCRKKANAVRCFVLAETLLGFAFLAKSLADGSGLCIDLRYMLAPFFILLLLFVFQPDRKNITLDAIQISFTEINSVEGFINKLEQTRFVLRNYHKSEEYNEYLHGMLEVFAEEAGPQRRRKLLTVTGALDPQTYLQEEMREFIRNLSDKYIWGIHKFNGDSRLVLSYCYFLRETDSTSAKSKRIQEALAIVDHSFFTSFEIYCLK